MKIIMLLEADDIINATDTVCIPEFHERKWCGEYRYDHTLPASEFCPAYIGKAKKELDANYLPNKLITEIRRNA
jgi:hypothetical protein